MRLALLDAVGEDLAHERRHLLWAAERAAAHQEGLERTREIARRREAVLLALRERLHHAGLELGRVARDDRRRRRDDARLDLLERVEIGVHAEEALVGRQLPEHDAEREDVGGAIDLGPAHLLGRHIGELALERARARRRQAIGDLGDAEVDDLGVALVRQEEVVRRDVAVDEAEELPVLAAQLVGRVEAVGRVGADARREVGHDPHVPLFGAPHHLAQRLAVEVLHGDPVGVVVLPEVEHLRDVGVVDPRGDPRLVEEHIDELVIFDEVRVDALDRHPLLEAARSIHPRQVDARHATDADLVDDAVAAEKEGAGLLVGFLGAEAGCGRRRPTCARGST